MICLMTIELPASHEPFKTAIECISGWIIAVDMHDARRQAYAAFQNDLAQELYRAELEPPPGKYRLPTGHIMVVT